MRVHSTTLYAPNSRRISLAPSNPDRLADTVLDIEATENLLALEERVRQIAPDAGTGDSVAVRTACVPNPSGCRLARQQRLGYTVNLVHNEARISWGADEVITIVE